MVILLFLSRIPQSSSARPYPPSQSCPQCQMAKDITVWRQSRPAPTHNLDIPPHYLKITLTFTQLLFLPPQLSSPYLCSTSCFPLI